MASVSRLRLPAYQSRLVPRLCLRSGVPCHSLLNQSVKESLLRSLTQPLNFRPPRLTSPYCGASLEWDCDANIQQLLNRWHEINGNLIQIKKLSCILRFGNTKSMSKEKCLQDVVIFLSGRMRLKF